MKLAKYLGGAALAVVLLFVFVVNFSSVESRYQCVGTLTSAGNTKPATVYIKFAEYRWWVHLWSDSDGALWLEIPNQAYDYFGQVTRVGDTRHIASQPNKGIGGLYSTLSGTLALDTSLGFFDGTCRPIDA